MNIHEYMVAIISYLCELEKSNDYAVQQFETSSVAELMQLPLSAVIRATELAERKGYVKAQWQYYAGHAGPTEGYFTLTPSAHHSFENRGLASEVGVSSTVIVQYSQMAIAQVGSGHSANQSMDSTVDLHALKVQLDRLEAGLLDGSVEVSAKESYSLGKTVSEVRLETSRTPLNMQAIREKLNVIGSLASIHSALQPYYQALLHLFGLG